VTAEVIKGDLTSRVSTWRSSCCGYSITPRPGPGPWVWCEPRLPNRPQPASFVNCWNDACGGRPAEKMPLTNPHTAAGLVATRVLGLVMTRYVIRAEPIASLAEHEVVELIAPALQRALSSDDRAESRP
jgi:hypothetical protein